MFRGVNSINLDTKGRVALPTRYRELVHDWCEGQLVLTVDTEEKCLLLYPLNEWEIIERKIEALPSLNKAARRLQRLLIGHATEIELDGAGRFLIPGTLREYAGLEKKAVLIGQGKKFEVWAESHWQQRREEWLEDTGDEDDLPESMQSLSL